MEESKQPKTRRQKMIMIGSLALTLIAVVILGLMLKAYCDGHFNSVETMRLYMARYGFMGPVLLTSFQAIQVVIPVLPGFLGCAVGSMMFGPAIGFCCNYLGIAGGSIIAFYLARHFGMPLIRDLFPKESRYRKWSDWASKSRSYAAFLFMAMLLPLFPDDYLCYLTGITNMKSKRFIQIILFGKPWCILAYCLGFSMIK